MARYLLTRNPASLARLGLGVALGLASCRRGEPAPRKASAAASAAVSASAEAFVASARQAHFDTELKRARERWASRPGLGDCAAALHEKADLSLCQAAGSVLVALEQDPDAAPDVALPRLANAALALARLSQRTRFLSLSELAQKKMTSDAGAPPSASARRPLPAPQAFAAIKRGGGHGTLEMGDGPVSQLMNINVRLERDVMRNLGAYLEYAELPVRRTAFDTVKRLQSERPQWPLLDRLLREAALLESDSELKHSLGELVASGLPRGNRPGQSTDSK